MSDEISEAALLITDEGGRIKFTSAFQKSYNSIQSIDISNVTYIVRLLSRAHAFFYGQDFNSDLESFGTHLGFFIGLMKLKPLSLLLEPGSVVEIFDKLYLGKQGHRPYSEYIKKKMIEWLKTVEHNEGSLMPMQLANFKEIEHGVNF